ncbi:MAG: hypothetical protein LBK04_01120, partial [Clostridiales Family XIII bacterium]|nr:hypothetical protein [Clostridiales Family XIII bacterium]
DAQYASRYAPKGILVKIGVGAREESKEGLEAAVTDAANGSAAVLGRVLPAGDNYLEEDLSNLQAMHGAAGKAVADAASGEVVPQGYIEALLKGLEDAIEALHHDHRLISNSAEGGVKAKGEGVAISIKGEYGTVTSVTLNGKGFTIGADTGNNSRGMLFGGKASGTVSKGSLVVSLTPEFIDSLPNGKYEIASYFDDGYMDGYGYALFEIDRPADEEAAVDDEKPGGKQAGAESSGGLGSYGSGATEGSTSDGSGGAATSPDSTVDSGKDTGSSPVKPIPADPEGNSNLVLWVAITLAAAAVITIIALIASRRRSQDDEDGYRR